MRVHDLKCWPEPFDAVASGRKPFELRKNDRDYAVGDVLHLHRFDPRIASYTGEQVVAVVSYITTLETWFPGTHPDAVVLGLPLVWVLAPHERSAPARTSQLAETNNHLIADVPEEKR